MKKLLPVFLWIPTTLFAISISFLMLVIVDAPQASSISTIASEKPIIPSSQVLGSYHSNIIPDDARPKIIARFLKQYQCPLTPYEYYGDLFVNAADKYHLDFRLLPAIAMQESNCCKKMPDGSNNCWGYGIYGDKTVHFSSIEEGINTVAKTLSKNYTKKGLMEPDEIMSKYTPSSKGTWAYGVLYFMNQMK